ncbi:MAG: transcriptional regulator [Kordiimonadaceae bacterium]|nr:transcriptional regulator [Kordiimonadaceae bacterium]
MSGYDYRAIDDFIHSRVRLTIMSFLAAARSAEFTELKTQLKVSDGNLSTHLKKLEEAEYISIRKLFQGKKPQTLIAISEKGDTAFQAYVEELGQMIGLGKK